MNNIDNKKRIFIFSVLLVIIAVQLSNITHTFAVKKTGENADEVWSYGLANSYYEPYIFSDDHRIERNKYQNEWIDGSVLKDYVTVREDQRFSYGSTIYNLKCDEHPPLWFLILHTICSFFPGKYSLWFGFFINIVCFVITMLYLYLLVLKYSNNYMISLLALLFFGFSGGGVTLYIFVRHYAMAAMFVVMMVYYHFCLLTTDSYPINEKKGCTEQKDARKKNRLYILIFLTSSCALLTLYMSVIPAFVMSLFVCIWYLKKKEIKKMLLFSFMMFSSLIPVVTLSGLFTGKMSLEGMTVNARHVSLLSFLHALPSKLKVLINSLMKDFVGFGLPRDPVYCLKIIISTVLFLTVIILPAVVFLCKNRIFIPKQYLRKRKEELVLIYKSRECEEDGEFKQEKKLLFVSVIVMIIVTMLAVISVSVFKEIGGAISRYVFLLYPLITFVVVVVFYRLLLWMISFAPLLLRKNKTNYIIVIVGLMTIVLLHKNYNIVYLFPRYDNDAKLEELVKGKKCALFLSEHWLLTSYADLLMDAEEVYVGETGNDDSVSAMMAKGIIPDYIIVDVEGYIQNSWMIYYSEDQLKSIETREKLEENYLPVFYNCLGSGRMIYDQMDCIFTRHIFVYSVEK